MDEKLADNAQRMGSMLREELSKIPKDLVSVVRGKGLLNAIVIHTGEDDTVCVIVEPFHTNMCLIVSVVSHLLGHYVCTSSRY